MNPNLLGIYLYGLQICYNIIILIYTGNHPHEKVQMFLSFVMEILQFTCPRVVKSRLIPKIGRKNELNKDSH